MLPCSLACATACFLIVFATMCFGLGRQAELLLALLSHQYACRALEMQESCASLRLTATVALMGNML